jgi:hypothetical protein
VTELQELLKGLRSVSAAALVSVTSESLWRLRSELHLLKAHLEAHPREGSAGLRSGVDATLALAGDAHALALELRSGLSDKAYAQFASLLELGAIGSVGIETLLVVERRRVPALLLGGLAELLTYLASREYVKGAGLRLAGIAQAQAPRLQDELWAALRRYRAKATGAERREAQAAIDAFFAKALDTGVPPEAQAMLVAGAMQLLLRVRVVEVLQAAHGATNG